MKFTEEQLETLEKENSEEEKKDQKMPAGFTKTHYMGR